MALDPVTAAFEVGGKLIDKFWPDASEAEKTKQQQFLAVFVAQADIVKTLVAHSRPEVAVHAARFGAEQVQAVELLIAHALRATAQ